MRPIRAASALLLFSVSLSSGARSEPADPTGESPAAPQGAEAHETVVVAPPPSPFAGVVEQGHLDRPAGAPATLIERLQGSAAAAIERNARGEQLIQLHGFEQRQLLVHFDGVPLRLPFDGRLDLGKIPQGLVERVELLRGPAPLSMGPSGMGGAVALRGADPRDGDRLSASARAAPHATVAGATGRLALGRWGGLLVAADLLDDRGAPLPRRDRPESSRSHSQESQGYLENRDRRGGALGLLGRASPAAGHEIDLVGIAWLGAFGVPRSQDAAVPRFWRFPEHHVALLRLGHRGRYSSGLTVSEQVGVTLYRNVLLGYDDATYSSRRTHRAFRSIYEDLTTEVGARFSQALPGRGPLRDVMLHGMASLRMDAHRQRDDLSLSSSPSQDSSLGSSLAVAELMGEAALEGSLRFQGGHVLVVQVEALVSGPVSVPKGGASPSMSTHVGPLVGYGFTGRRVSVAFTLARKARLPSLRERYADAFGVQAPNPGLRPESAWHGWLSATWRPWRWLALSAFPFAAHLSDRIERQSVPDGLPQQVNAGTGILAGLELTARVDLPFGLKGRVAYQWLHTRRSDPPPGEPPELLGRAPHQAVAQISYHLPHRLSITTSLRLRSPQLGQDPDTGLVSELPTCVTWHGRVEWGPHRGIRLLLAAENLLDASCASTPGYPEPGRLLWAGVSLSRR